MTTAAIRKKLVDYLQTADDKKVKAIYTMVEDDIYSSEHGINKEFIEELDRRTLSFENGTAKMYSWEGTKQAAIERVKAKKSNGISI